MLTTWQEPGQMDLNRPPAVATAPDHGISLPEESCPYLDIRSDACGASLTGFRVSVHYKETTCHTDRSGDCPMALSKMIRMPDQGDSNR